MVINMTVKKWKLLLILSFLMFIYSLFEKQLWLTVLALTIGIVVKKQNIFKDYSKKQRQKRNEYRALINGLRSKR